jgi:two-component system, NarL family, sensor histidine kinase UhpB
MTGLNAKRKGGSVLEKLWYGQSLRTQLLVAVGLINLCALALAGTVSIVNARDATREEIEGSLEMAKHFVRGTVQALQPEGNAEPLSKNFNQLTSRLQLARLRHVRIFVADGSGQLVQVSPQEQVETRAPGAPAWFAALVEPSVTPQQLSVLFTDPQANTLTMVEQPRETMPDTWDLGTVVVAGDRRTKSPRSGTMYPRWR